MSVFDVIFHFNTYIPLIMEEYGGLIYALLFAIIFCETGLVVTPFLPGDSVLFTCGALAATAAGLNIWLLFFLLLIAAVTGDATNYYIGKKIGYRLLNGSQRFIKPKHLQKAEDFYAKYGGKAILLSRFVPIIRTFAPFVAGIGKMTYHHFAIFNIAGGIIWVAVCLAAGYFFGNLPMVQENFTFVLIAIIAISLLPVLVEYLRSKKDK